MPSLHDTWTSTPSSEAFSRQTPVPMQERRDQAAPWIRITMAIVFSGVCFYELAVAILGGAK